jgi:hypothetical protein
MIERPKEATVEPSTTTRMLTAAALASALTMLVAAPAQAMLLNEGGGGGAPSAVVGNPGDGPSAVASTAQTRIYSDLDPAIRRAMEAQFVADLDPAIRRAMEARQAELSGQVGSPQASSPAVGNDGSSVDWWSVGGAVGASLIVLLGFGIVLSTFRHRVSTT